MDKKNFLILFITISVSSLFFLTNFEVSQTGTEHNLSGWAWAGLENIGWISFNCNSKVDTNSDGIVDQPLKVCNGGVNANKLCNPGNPKAVTCPEASCVDACNVVNYGVNINADGIFSGYAWSENIGWISFNEDELSGCPATPCRAWVDLSTKEVSGWARACAVFQTGCSGNLDPNRGGWDGWIRLRGLNYGVSLDTSVSPAEFQGWAWSDMVIGWISFNCKDRNVCSTSNYKVTTTFVLNQPPNKPGVPTEYPEGEAWNHCAFKGVSIPTFHWTYSDPEGDPQTGYEIRIDDDSDFSVVDADEFKCNGQICSGGASTSFTPIPSPWENWMNWNTDYWWIVRVKDDDHNHWSAWSEPNHFKTPKHAYPSIDFSWVPLKPSVNEIVQFTDKSTVYGGATKKFWYWTFEHGQPEETSETSNQQNPTVKFLSPSPKGNRVTLSVTDSDGFSCTGEKYVNLQLPLPEWKEIPPFIWLRNFLASISEFLHNII